MTWTAEHDKRARLISEQMIATFGDDQDNVARLCREIAELMVGSCDEIERLRAERDAALPHLKRALEMAYEYQDGDVYAPYAWQEEEDAAALIAASEFLDTLQQEASR